MFQQIFGSNDLYSVSCGLYMLDIFVNDKKLSEFMKELADAKHKMGQILIDLQVNVTKRDTIIDP